MDNDNLAAWSAVASTIAAFASLAVTVVVARSQQKFEEKRRIADDKKAILAFIEDLSQACGYVWVGVEFAELDLGKQSIVDQLEDTSRISANHSEAFKVAEREITRFDDAAIGPLIAVLRGVRGFQEFCRDSAAELRRGATPDRVQHIWRHFEHRRGVMSATIEALGPHLVRYGAVRQSWHGTTNDGDD